MAASLTSISDAASSLADPVNVLLVDDQDIDRPLIRAGFRPVLAGSQVMKASLVG